MKYRSNLDNALSNIDLNIKEQTRIAIAGRTGSGKSSLTLAIMRIVEGNNGNIMIDGVDISKIKIKSLRKLITIIP